jgi:Flp pilus assembly secretin CpaC
MSVSSSIGSLLRRAAGSLILCGVIAGASATAASSETLIVKVDEARPVKVPPGTQTLIIGNPSIADVTLLKQGSVMIVTGKGFGQTNFIALDAAGNQVADSVIQVVNADNALIVQRGLDRQSYTCAPACQPSVRLGDDAKYFGEVSSQVQAHTSQANGK